MALFICSNEPNYIFFFNKNFQSLKSCNEINFFFLYKTNINIGKSPNNIFSLLYIDFYSVVCYAYDVRIQFHFSFFSFFFPFMQLNKLSTEIMSHSQKHQSCTMYDISVLFFCFIIFFLSIRV